MIGASTDPRAWLHWFTPLGWLDLLHLYGDPEPLALVPLLLVPVVLGAGAVVLRARRDTGSALLVAESGRSRRSCTCSAAPRRSHGAATVLCCSPGSSALGAYAAIMGAILASMIDWLAGDEGYQRILAAMGLDQALTNKGFLAFIAHHLRPGGRPAGRLAPRGHPSRGGVRPARGDPGHARSPGCAGWPATPLLSRARRDPAHPGGRHRPVARALRGRFGRHHLVGRHARHAEPAADRRAHRRDRDRRLRRGCPGSPSRCPWP